MSLDKKLLSQSKTLLDERRRKRESELSDRIDTVYKKLPLIREIDAELRGTIASAVSRALMQGEDPEQALLELREENLHLQDERREALMAAGYPADYLDEKYMCPKCRDTGYDGTEICSCLRDIYREEQRKSLSNLLKLGSESFDSFELKWYDDIPDPETGISPRMNMENIYEFCVIYARRFGKRSPNLLFTGQTGLGKTFLSACIAREVSDKGASVVYDTAASVFAMFEHAKFDRGTDSEEAREYIARCMDADLFILDDLGTELSTAFVTSALYELINTRLIRGKKTVINTNLRVSELQSRYSPQISSRIEGEYQVFPFFGKDIRLLKKEI